MSNNINHFQSFARGAGMVRASIGSSLTNEQIQARVPSVFAASKHASRSEKYTFLSTEDLLAGLRLEGFFPVEVRQNGSKFEDRRGFVKHMIRFRHDLGSLSHIGDTLPEIVLVNSHDGSGSYKIFAGLLRLVCLNGLVVADTDKFNRSFVVNHRGNVLSDVIRATYQIASETEAVLDTIHEWSKIVLTTYEQIAFATAAKSLRFDKPEDIEITAEEILKPRRSFDDKPDLWSVFNRIQENFIRGGLDFQRRDINNRLVHGTTRRINSIDGDVKLNRSLWTLAEALKATKN